MFKKGILVVDGIEHPVRIIKLLQRIDGSRYVTVEMLSERSEEMEAVWRAINETLSE